MASKCSQAMSKEPPATSKPFIAKTPMFPPCPPLQYGRWGRALDVTQWQVLGQAWEPETGSEIHLLPKRVGAFPAKGSCVPG